MIVNLDVAGIACWLSCSSAQGFQLVIKLLQLVAVSIIAILQGLPDGTWQVPPAPLGVYAACTAQVKPPPHTMLVNGNGRRSGPSLP